MAIARSPLGGFEFERDEYFAHITWPGRHHSMPVDCFLRAMMRDVAWNFFYGTVNFDGVFGTINHYGSVEMFAGRYNSAIARPSVDHVENFDSDDVMAKFKAMLDDWTNEGFDPFAAPQETGQRVRREERQQLARRSPQAADRQAHGRHGGRHRRCAPTPAAFRSTAQFADVARTSRRCTPSRASRTRCTRSICSSTCRAPTSPGTRRLRRRCKDSLFCPTTEEYILPVIHGNDRVEWFVQLSDEINWEVERPRHRRPRARVTMKAGDVAAMPADIRHQGYSPKRSMLLVWENNDATLPELYAKKRLKSNPVDF